MGYICINPSCRTSWEHDFDDGKCPICRKSIIPTSLASPTADPLASQTTHTGTHVASLVADQKALDNYLATIAVPDSASIPGFIQTKFGKGTPGIINVKQIVSVLKNSVHEDRCWVTVTATDEGTSGDYDIGETYEEIVKKIRYAVR